MSSDELFHIYQGYGGSIKFVVFVCVDILVDPGCFAVEGVAAF